MGNRFNSTLERVLQEQLGHDNGLTKRVSSDNLLRAIQHGDVAVRSIEGDRVTIATPDGSNIIVQVLPTEHDDVPNEEESTVKNNNQDSIGRKIDVYKQLAGGQAEKSGMFGGDPMKRIRKAYGKIMTRVAKKADDVAKSIETDLSKM